MARRDQETETTPEVVEDPQQIGIEEALEPAPVVEPEDADQEADAILDDPEALAGIAEAEAERGEQSLVDAIAGLDAQEREQLARALEVVHIRESRTFEGLTAGDYADLGGHAYVTFPDGSVVTASRQILVGQPGEYTVTYWGKGQGSETFTVAEKDAEA